MLFQKSAQPERTASIAICACGALPAVLLAISGAIPALAALPCIIFPIAGAIGIAVLPADIRF